MSSISTSRITTRLRAATVVGACCAMLSLGSVLALVDTRPVAERARDWAAANATSLPATLDELSRYPVPFRVAAFQEMSPEERSRIVRQHLSRVEARYSLTQAQRQLINTMIAELGPEAYSDTGHAAAQARLGPICSTIQQLFSPEQRAVLGTLGPQTPSESRLRQWIRSAKAVAAPYLVDAKASARTSQFCSCAIQTSCSGCALEGGICQSGDCTPTGYGCGCGFVWSCDGVCIPIPSKHR